MSSRSNRKLITTLACMASGAVGIGGYAYYKVCNQRLN